MKRGSAGLKATGLVSLLLQGAQAWAGRPLSVDNADIVPKGTGHVEAWAARQAGKTNILNVAPAFSFWEAVELSAVLARNRSNAITSVSGLVRVRVTPVRTQGCNVLATLGQQHDNPGGNQPFVYSAVTCNSGKFALHANLGAAKPAGSSGYGTWGVALEQDRGSFVPHLEAFGQEHARPTFQLGARTDVAKGWQVDGTLGRTAGETMFSLGAKFSF